MVDATKLRQEVLSWLSGALHTPVENIDLTRPFPEIGLDSLDAVHMVAMIESLIDRELPEDVIRRVGCLNDMFEIAAQRAVAA